MHYLFRKRFFCDIGNICWRLSMQIGSQCEIWSLTSHVKSKGVLVFPAILSSSEVNFPFVKRSSYDDVNTSCGPWFHDAFRELSTWGGPVTKVFGVQWIFYIYCKTMILDDMQWGAVTVGDSWSTLLVEEIEEAILAHTKGSPGCCSVTQDPEGL